MLKRRICALSILASMLIVTPVAIITGKAPAKPTPVIEHVVEATSIAEAVVLPASNTIAEEIELVEENTMPDEDVDLIALLAMGEAEGECEQGQRLVIDSVLNRMDHERFPDTVEGVIYQRNAYSCMWDGRIEKCEVTDELRQLVREELVSRTDSDVIFFRTNHYSGYGEPMYVVGNHYFSSYE